MTGDFRTSEGFLREGPIGKHLVINSEGTTRYEGDV